MIKFNTALVAAALLISGGAMAASVEPVAGNAPYFSQPVAMTNSIERSAVEAQAVAQRPVAGNLPFVAQTAPVGVWQARSTVTGEALVRPPVVGDLPFAS